MAETFLKTDSIFHGRYAIKRMLGSGAMGAVYEARQLDAERTVALKLLNLDRVSSEEDRARFLRECRALSALSHKNIVSFYSAAISDEGIPYYVCEYVQGKTLRAVLNVQAKFSWIETVKIITQIADAMEAAHNANIVHRDLKPENIMLLDLPEKNFVKVLDFGLARLNEAEAPANSGGEANAVKEAVSLTRTGTLIGTVNYMSPEQCLGRKVDSRSDIYSLGCIAYECVSGKKLFDADHAMGVLHQHVNASAEPALKALEETCPEEFIEILRGMLAKSLDARLQTMAIVLNELSADSLKNAEIKNRRQKAISPVLSYSIIGVIAILAFVGLVFVFQKWILKQNHDKAVGAGVSGRRSFTGVMPEQIGLNDDPSHNVVLIQRWLEDNSGRAVSSRSVLVDQYTLLAAVYAQLAAERNRLHQPQLGKHLGKKISDQMLFQIKRRNSSSDSGSGRHIYTEYLLLLSIAVSDDRFDEAKKIFQDMVNCPSVSSGKNECVMLAATKLRDYLEAKKASRSERMELLLSHISYAQKHDRIHSKAVLLLEKSKLLLESGQKSEAIADLKESLKLLVTGPTPYKLVYRIANVGASLNGLGESDYFIKSLNEISAEIESQKPGTAYGGSELCLQLGVAYKNIGDLSSAVHQLVQLQRHESALKDVASFQKDNDVLLNAQRQDLAAELLALAINENNRSVIRQILDSISQSERIDHLHVLMILTARLNNSAILFQRFYENSSDFEQRFPVAFGDFRLLHAHYLLNASRKTNDKADILDAAIAEFEKGIADVLLGGKFHVNVLSGYNAEALCFLEKNDWKSAQRIIDKAASYHPPDEPAQAESYRRYRIINVQALIYLRTKGKAEALEFLDKHCSECIDQIKKDPPENIKEGLLDALITFYHGILQLYTDSADFPGAATRIDEQNLVLESFGVDLDVGAINKPSDNVRAHYCQICGSILAHVGRKSDAVKYYQREIELLSSLSNKLNHSGVIEDAKAELKKCLDEP